MHRVDGRPTLSVIMSNYNHARFLPVAMDSVLAQSHRPSEVIIIDDGSTDESPGVIEEYARREPLIRFIRNERNMGILHNLVKLLELASGDYIVGCACDDAVMPGFFEKSMGLLARHPEAGLCSSLSLIMDGDGGNRRLLPSLVVSKAPTYLPPREVRRLLLSVGNWMIGNTTILRREALLDVGGFLPELRSFTDNFAAQAMALKYGACFIPEPLALWRRMEGTYSVSVHRDPREFREMVDAATGLMRTRFKDIFPQAYPRLWERETVFERERLCLSRDISSSRSGGVRRRLDHLLKTSFLLAKHRPMLTVRRAIRRKLFSPD